MITALIVIFFVLGLIVGSFLNVVIYRMNTHRDFGGRSICLSCSSTISWYDLVPVVSFLCLRGRCRNCKSKISWQYPAVELFTALIFGLFFVKFLPIFFEHPIYFVASYAFYTAFFSLLLVVVVHDIRHKIIPDALSFILGLLAFGGLFLFKDYIFFPHIPTVTDFLSGLIVSVPFGLIWLISRGRWMGLGDAKLAIGLGWIVGFIGTLSATIIAFWAGAIIGLFILTFKKGELKSEVPFAPFLALGTILVFLFQISLFGF